MSISPESIEIGQCYATRLGRVQRAIRILPDGRVHFEMRANMVRQKWLWRPGIADLRTFATSCERPVPCDWTLESDAGGDAGRP